MSASNPIVGVRVLLPVQMKEGVTHQQPNPKDNFKPWGDPLFTDLRRLFSRARLREVLTHSSFYGQDGKGNSRYVFAGMYVFKGQVGEILFRYFTGEGTHLQHVLGNLFRQERLIRLYDEWHLKQFVRAGDNFDVERHKHIFVYALFGYVATLDETTRNWFISKYILGDNADYLIKHKRRNIDVLAQADAMVQQADGRRLSLEMELTNEGLHKAKAVLSDGTLLCEAESKSWRYARTKASKMALNLLATPQRKILLSNPAYHEKMLERLKEEKAKRKAEVEEREAQKKARLEIKREQRKAEARIRDAKRRKSKAESKKRKAENAARAAAKAAKAARPMSAKKRRYLEDKKK